jgi:hypothetical protein
MVAGRWAATALEWFCRGIEVLFAYEHSPASATCWNPRSVTRGTASTAWRPQAARASRHGGQRPTDTLYRTGVLVPGPGSVTIPSSAEPGDYRLFTSNAGENSCAQVTLGQ